MNEQNWINKRVVPDEIEKHLDSGKSFIDGEKIFSVLSNKEVPDKKQIRDILDKARAIETLSLEEAGALINVPNEVFEEEIAPVCLEVKKKVYDNRIVTFAPLYMSSYCVNNCLYCAFRRENDKAQRVLLSMDEIKREVEALTGKIGHKRLIVVYGEHPLSGIEYMLKSIDAVYSVKVKAKYGLSQIRRVNVNAPPMQLNELKRLNAAGIGTYQVFQETYHRHTYEQFHPKDTIKGNYLWRLYVMHRAMDAGIDDVGIGVLLGLYDWRFEVLALLMHAIELERRFGIGPHTISFPRVEPAYNTPFADNPKHKVSDSDFLKLIGILRLAVPYTGLIITAREPKHIRDKSFLYGVTQTDASSKIGLGTYSEEDVVQHGEKQQFFLGDTRTLDELIGDLADMGYITSFCTAGYRCGRTGKNIMELLKSGQEGMFCKLNAVLTFREWIDDFASEETREKAEGLIDFEINQIREKMPDVFPKLMEYYEKTKQGMRDLYF